MRYLWSLGVLLAAVLLAASDAPGQSASGQTPSPVTIVPASPTQIGNCIPFGNNTSFGFTGFIYRNVPAFLLLPGDHFSFDLGDVTNEDARRNIYFARANIDPDPPVVFFANVISQGVHATRWTRVVSDTQVPLNPKGNTVVGDYELTYEAEDQFRFFGGGLIVGFGGSPPGNYADGGCTAEQVLVTTTADDASGQFYSRFLFKPDQTLGVLDDLTAGAGSAVELGGIIISATGEPPVGGKVELAVSADARPTARPDDAGQRYALIAAGAAGLGMLLILGGWRLVRRAKP